MLLDARTLEDGHERAADICVIGAGAAGITIARELTQSALDVCLVESGGLEPHRASQALFEAENVGLPYFDPTYTRLRYFGGATNHWGGHCRPLDEVDFEERPWVPDSGWPLALSDLEPYYERAASVVQIGRHERFASIGWDEAAQMYPEHLAYSLADSSLPPALWQLSPPTRFGEAYREDLEKSENVTVLLHANLVGYEGGEEAAQVERVRLATLDGARLAVRARVFVLACGAIENARLLLAVADSRERALGGDNAWVGQCFMEHPAYRDVGVIVPEGAPALADVERGDIEISARIADALQRENELVNSLIFLDPRAEGADSSGVRSAKSIYDDVRRGTLPDELFAHLGRIFSDLRGVVDYGWRRASSAGAAVSHYNVTLALEQVPNRASRVRLSDTRDALGMPQAALDWRLDDLDREGLMAVLRTIGRELGAAGLGRLKLNIQEDGGDFLEFLSGSYHHMGTTRMHDDPAHGVVDRDGRLHGKSNVYVAGSSVFPTAGASSPTYTIVALALRLSDHLREQYAV